MDKGLMRQLLFVQGGGSNVHDDWDNKLVASLAHALKSTYDIRYPRMPNEDDPDYESWKSALKEELAALEDHAVLVGHSLGGTILVSLLAERDEQRTFAGLFLLSTPYIGEGGWTNDDIPSMVDIGARLPPHMPVFLYYGSQDETATKEHLKLYRRAIPRAVPHLLLGADHQLGNDLSAIAAEIQSLGQAT